MSDCSQLLPDLPSLQRQLLKIFFGTLLAAISLIWMSEAWIRHDINAIDQVAYPMMILSISLSLILLQGYPQHYTLAVMGTVGIVSLYSVTFLQAIIWGYIPLADDYTLGTFAQWFPLTYILLFLFLQKRQALMVSLGIYGSLVLSTVINAYGERSLPTTAQKFPYLLHLVMSHPLYIAVFVAVSTLQMSFAAARLKAERADVDHLTNLANRHAATRTLEAALVAQTDREQRCVGVILVDVDWFKTINDTYGHGIGDRVLVQVAQLLQQDLRKTDLVARWGGEEFLVVLSNTTAADVVQTAERLRSRLAAHLHPGVGQVTASFGIATTTTASEKIEILLARADEALYQAKKQGRNRVYPFPIHPSS